MLDCANIHYTHAQSLLVTAWLPSHRKEASFKRQVLGRYSIGACKKEEISVFFVLLCFLLLLVFLTLGSTNAGKSSPLVFSQLLQAKTFFIISQSLMREKEFESHFFLCRTHAIYDQ
jgi:hypothetical protein